VAAANAVLDVIEEEALCARADAIGERIAYRLGLLAAGAGAGAIGNIRGLGAMIAFELVSGGDPMQPNQPLTQKIIAEAEARGLIIIPCGPHGNVIRLLPPLTTPMEQVDEALDIIDASLVAALALDAAA